MTAYGLRSHSGRVLRVGVEWAWGSAKGATSLHGGEEGKVSYLGVLGPVPIPVHKYVLRAHWVQGAGLRLAVAGLCPLLCWEAVSLLAGACPVAPTHSHPQPPPWLGKDHAASPALIVNVFFFFLSVGTCPCLYCLYQSQKEIRFTQPIFVAINECVPQGEGYLWGIRPTQRTRLPYSEPPGPGGTRWKGRSWNFLLAASLACKPAIIGFQSLYLGFINLV